MKSKKASGFSFYIILLVIITIVAFSVQQYSKPKEMNLTEVMEKIHSGQIEKVTLDKYTIVATEKAEKGKVAKIYKKQISPLWVGDLYKELNELREEGKIKAIDYNEPLDLGGMFSMGLTFILVAFLVGFIYITFSKQNGEGKGALGFGKSRARMNDPTKNKVTFADVAGADEEKEELAEVVDFLKSPKKYQSLGAKIPRGILLIGAPGTGKTLLAKAVAGEAGVPFFSISGSDFVEMFVGVGASRVRDLFENAKKQAPCIIFIDEIDAVGRQRGAGLGGGHDEREQTLNQLLVEMDGFGPVQNVIVMAATNRPDILDPALMRPGRFDRRINVMRPDLNGREAILKVHARNKPISEKVKLKEIAKITPGFTGADLANLLNEAALLAARRNAQEIVYADISEAVFKVTIGPEKKSRIISEKEKNLTAYHEGGHAVILRAVSETQKVERVSIIPAGGAGGYTAYKPHEDIYFETKGHLIQSIMVSLGGRAAEELTQADISTGASSDLQACNAIARDMIVKYGMSKRLENFVMKSEDEVFLGRDYGHVTGYSQETLAIVDEEVKEIINEAYRDVLKILKDNKVLLDELAKVLLEKEKIEGDEFEELYRKYAINYKPMLHNDEEAADKNSDVPVIEVNSEANSPSEDFAEENTSTQDTSEN